MYQIRPQAAARSRLPSSLSRSCDHGLTGLRAGALIEAVEDGLPGRLRRIHHLPVLADGPVRLRRPGNPLTNGFAGLRVRAIALEDHAPAYHAPIELERSAAVVDPGLVPVARIAVVEADAPAAAAVDGAPGFEQRAVLQVRLDHILARRPSALGHAPLPDPEVELPVLLDIAGRRGRSGSRLGIIGDCTETPEKRPRRGERRIPICAEQHPRLLKPAR